MKKEIWKIRRFLLLILYYFACVLPTSAQQLYTAVSTEVRFFSDAPLEDIEAVNKEGQSLINTQTREVAVKIPINSFVFPNKLMQQHFNENYLESDKFPHATFLGKISEAINFKAPGTYDVTATGKMTLHGVERNQTIKGKLTIEPGKFNLDAAFDVLLADHKIKIPKMVFMKIAEKIAVTVKSSYMPYEKKPQ